MKRLDVIRSNVPEAVEAVLRITGAFKLARYCALLATLIFAMLLLGASVSRGASPKRSSGIGLISLGEGLGSGVGRFNLSSYSVIIVGQAGAKRAAQLPGRSLLYACGVNIPNASWSATCGVPWATAVANDWILKNADGSYVSFGDGYSYLADIGNPSYQRAVVSRLVSILASDRGIDGVMLDNVQGYLIAPSLKYPDNSTYRAAMKSFIDVVGRALRKRSRYVAVSASMHDGTTPNWLKMFGEPCDASQTIWWYRQLAPAVNAFVTEYWEMNWDSSASIRFSGTSSCDQNWDGWQRLVGAVQRMGKDFFPLTSGTSDAAGVSKFTYLRASFLLDYNGGNSAFIYSAGGPGSYSASVDGWVGGMPWTLDIGQPVEAKYRVGVGWRRDFTRGTTLINPNPSTAQAFALGRAYALPDGSSATSVTLAPGTALLLRRSSR